MKRCVIGKLIGILMVLCLLPLPALAENGSGQVAVIYDLNGGTDEFGGVFVNGVYADADDGSLDGQYALSLPESVPLRDGYLFDGWYLEWDEIHGNDIKSFFSEKRFWPGNSIASENIATISERWFLRAEWAVAAPLETQILVNGAAIAPDVPPMIIDGRTMVPIRFISEALGSHVDYLPGDAAMEYPGKVTVTDGDRTIELWIGGPVTFIDGVSQTMDVPPVIVEGRTLVPLRFISEALGASVSWEAGRTTADHNTVSITR